MVRCVSETRRPARTVDTPSRAMVGVQRGFDLSARETLSSCVSADPFRTSLSAHVVRKAGTAARVGASVGCRALHVPQVMTDLVRVALHHIEGTDRTVLWVRCGDAVWCLEGGRAPRVRGGDQCDEAHDG